MTEYYKLSKLDVFSELNTTAHGLSEEEAQNRLEKYGKNELHKGTGVSKWHIFIQQFNDFIIWILIFASIIAGFTGEFVDMAVILVILVLNATLGFIQEFKAEKSIEALQKLTSYKATVLRDGHKKEIDASELVPGDVVFLDAGEKIPADSRLLEVHNFSVQEAALTGESVPVDKSIEEISGDRGIADRKNMVFAGTIATRGTAHAIITSTGMNTEIGKIATMIHSAESPDTPLQKRLKHLGKVLGVGVLLISVVVFLLGVLRGEDVVEMLLGAISLAVAAVPEGLPAVVTITLAIGVQKMIRKNSLIRKLPSVETLGSTNVICADKTGTLTHNQMTVKKMWVDNEIIKVEGSGYKVSGKFSKTTSSLKQLLKIGVLCNDASLEEKESQIVGDPTEVALLVSGAKLGLYAKTLVANTPRIDEIPFDSERKLMSTIHSQSRKKFILTKGAPEAVLKKCNRILIDGKVSVLSKHKAGQILEHAESFGKDALRVLGFAYRDIEGKANESALIFVGLQAMMDPPREEVVGAIAKCKRAGIAVKMITGDHKVTAMAIANKLGIEGKVVTGDELNKMSKHQLAKIIDKVGVFARASPQHKLLIVDALQHKGDVVAMTGDGVNDAPALKKADIGVAMGISGTDVAKEAADMVLVDDNFTSIVSAVEEGRTIFDNIQKFIEYLLSCNSGEVLTIFFAILLGLPLPLIAIQILLMNLITDGLPALSLALEGREPGIMEKPPRKKDARIVDKQGFIRMIVTGIVMTLGTLGVFIYSGIENHAYARTMAFTTLVMFQLWHVLNNKSLHLSFFKVGPLKNKWLIGAIGVSLILQLIILYTPLNVLFRTVPLSIFDWGVIVLVSSSIFIVREVWKMVEGARA
jgi:P-type Ca2+ transporter type 2C